MPIFLSRHVTIVGEHHEVSRRMPDKLMVACLLVAPSFTGEDAVAWCRRRGRLAAGAAPGAGALVHPSAVFCTLPRPRGVPGQAARGVERESRRVYRAVEWPDREAPVRFAPWGSSPHQVACRPIVRRTAQPQAEWVSGPATARPPCVGTRSCGWPRSLRSASKRKAAPYTRPRRQMRSARLQTCLPGSIRRERTHGGVFGDRRCSHTWIPGTICFWTVAWCPDFSGGFLRTSTRGQVIW